MSDTEESNPLLEDKSEQNQLRDTIGRWASKELRSSYEFCIEAQGRLTKEALVEYGKSLGSIEYRQFMLLIGRLDDANMKGLSAVLNLIVIDMTVCLFSGLVYKILWAPPS